MNMDRFHPDKVITVDFETMFDSKKKLGFKHQNTEEYIRDPRWRTHGVGVKKGGNETIWLHDYRKVAEFFKRVNFSEAVMVAHNAKFDGLILSHHYSVRPRHWADTRSLAYMLFGNALRSASLASLTKQFLPGEVKDQTDLFNIEGKKKLTEEEAYKLGEYCKGDCDKTHMLYQIFWNQLQDTDVPFNMLTMDMVTRMFTDPVLVLDPVPLGDLLAIEVAEKQAALDESVATDMKQLRSNEQFATLLKSHGVEPPTKVSPTTGKETYAFAKSDRGLVELLEHEREEVRNLVAARLRCKTSINETRAQSYIDVSHRGTWPVDLNLSGARTTHRLSGGMGGGGNPQNMGRGSKLREAVKAPPGFYMGACDSSNIELRIAMALANEREVVDKLSDPSFDLYSVFAAHLYGVEVGEVTKPQRLIGKIAMLSLQYGTGWQGFMNAAFNWGVEVDSEEAMRIVSMYRAAFPAVVNTWKALDYMLKKLAQGEHEGWWNDHLVVADPNTIAGVPGFTLPMSGLAITYPALRYERGEDSRRELVYTRWTSGYGGKKEDVRLWGAKAFENICQALARNVVFEQALELEHVLLDVDPACRTVMSIHDETVNLLPDHIDPATYTSEAERIFGTSPEWWPELPVFGEAHTGSSYADCK